ncbi:hypothetical protein Scep_025460 [Stephania cephalantha]|uniref:Uncharacterized protein n=1 Tax=Stephania cephalantha TaxID=152367 RepID=A0AAP0HRK9_9MAGN
MMAASRGSSSRKRCSGDSGCGLAVRTSRLVGAKATRRPRGVVQRGEQTTSSSSEKHGGWTTSSGGPVARMAIPAPGGGAVVTPARRNGSSAGAGEWQGWRQRRRRGSAVIGAVARCRTDRSSTRGAIRRISMTRWRDLGCYSQVSGAHIETRTRCFEDDSRFLEDVALAYIDGQRQMVCYSLRGLGGAQLVAEEPSSTE